MSMALKADLPTEQPEVSGRTLRQSVEAFLAAWSAENEVSVEVWALPDKAASDEAARLAFRVLVDALSMAREATRVSMALTVGRSLRLTVTDNGRGCEPEDHVIERSDDMRARITRMRGRCSVNSEPGNGTTVTLELPA
jgi:signal transduction histidine kinase